MGYAFNGDPVEEIQPFGGGHGQAQILQQAVVHAVHPAVQGDILATTPGILQHRALRHVDDLLNHIELHQCVIPRVLCDRVQQAAVAVAHILVWRSQLSARPMRAPSNAACTPEQP